MSLLRPVVNLRTVVDVEDVDNAAVLVDPVDDAIGASPGTMTASERPEQRLAHPMRVDRKRGIAELQAHPGPAPPGSPRGAAHDAVSHSGQRSLGGTT